MNPPLKTPPAKPLSAAEVLDACFLDARGKLLDVAATLDRIDRAPNLAQLRGDPRLQFLHDALALLQSPTPNRAEQLQKRWSK